MSNECNCCGNRKYDWLDRILLVPFADETKRMAENMEVMERCKVP